ncbi:hypothetical protein [Christiangramia aquimixticola]|uniref:hypothetical protein n=1 Tax=Christiangramia aquimixticola TaxID=1697558 RepID=UPI003AA928ED
MKHLLLLCLLLTGLTSEAQQNQKISTLEFVEILNENRSEALYYYQNNWAKLRERAMAKGYIASYELLETEPGPENPVSLILITTYADEAQFEKREDHFSELIREKGGLELLNDKKPGEFRKIHSGHAKAMHLD